jgi:hypothetical protein
MWYSVVNQVQALVCSLALGESIREGERQYWAPHVAAHERPQQVIYQGHTATATATGPLHLRDGARMLACAHASGGIREERHTAAGRLSRWRPWQDVPATDSAHERAHPRHDLAECVVVA